MTINFEPFFKKYEELVKAADDVFERVSKEHSECVKCKIECSDCCHAMFDLTLIEAMYINHKFKEKIEGNAREVIINKANVIDRQIHKIKRKAVKELEAGKDEDEILAMLAGERVRCPFLNSKDSCDLYEYRPITCRFYGIPTSIGGVGHTCGKSGFIEGEKYPTVNLDIIHGRLQQISAEFVKEIRTEYIKLVDMLVPLSMAILSVYDEEYLGIKE
ncbi:MAG: YkgJ family cysteine cluster protein [Thermodesulfobacteriota bacterium]|nr:YkgJ family cysteine cluster protein [Thermodesulfobacteriota bacterium]